MKLNRLTERIWVFPFEQERDRPNLSYIRGDRWSLAVDAGHSEAHTKEFYRALEEAGLPLPRLTVLTHWHWDHTFGMHAVHGLCLANEKTNGYLKAIREKIQREGVEAFFAFDEAIRREYAGNRPVTVTLADLMFSGDMLLDLGNCSVRLLRAEAPHTDDSTLIHATDEKVLFLGDAPCGAFPTWEKDPALCKKLADTVAAIDADICLESHWTPLTKKETLDDMLADANAAQKE
ncbi:MAG: MBL fold metallo-hydrolase [Clostridia bacterium]|nr:MBL fold metallo-hydrolase [Clostridia bacterium]